MPRKDLSEWLAWQETLNPAEIDLGLERVRLVAGRLDIRPPEGGVVVVAGTNGKGSVATTIAALAAAGGRSTGLYTSPHLVRYNERIRVNATDIDDAQLVAAFEQIEAVRGATPLTFFEFGTLAALLVFTRQNCAVWVLEVGLGGRLDAVNIMAADVAVITTVDIDHQAWLGTTIEAIALEKAGVMRAGKPVLFGDKDVPEAIRLRAGELGADLGVLNQAYRYAITDKSWHWQGAGQRFDNLPMPVSGMEIQVRNQAAALAAIELLDKTLLQDAPRVAATLQKQVMPGRLQEFHDSHHWLLDVAHNVQAAEVLRMKIESLPAQPTVIIVGMLADKQAEEFAEHLTGIALLWVACPTDADRGSSAAELAARLERPAGAPILLAESVSEALETARDALPDGGRIVVCGSFLIVGPVLKQLGLY